VIKNIVNIFERDIKTIAKNRAALLTVVGMCVLPCLYTLVNVEAIWDPYSSVKTSDISIAVVNKDKGTEFQGENLNLGNSIVDNLKKNHSIGWKFVNSEDANQGLLNGRYYAVIEIPEDFSSDITSIAGNNPRKAQVLYEANTKRSPMAIKITDSAANSLVDSIKSNFIYSVNKAVFSYLNIIGENAEKNKYNIIALKDSIIFLGDNIDLITTILGNINDSSNNLAMILTQLKPAFSALGNADIVSQNDTDRANLVKSMQTSFNNSLDNIQMDLGNAKGDVHKLQDLVDELNSLTGAANSSNINSTVDKINNRISELENEVNSIMNFLKTVNSFSRSNKISSFLSSLKYVDNLLNSEKNNVNNLKQQLNKMNEADYSVKRSAESTAVDIEDKLTGLSNEYINEVRGPLNNIANDFVDSLNSSADILKTAENIDDQGSKSLEVLIDGSKLLASSSGKLENKINKFKDVILNVSDQLKLISNDDIVKIITVLQSNPELMGNFVANPFNIVEENIYTVPNFGSAFAPTYMTLSIWVGCTMLAAVLKTTVAEFKGAENFTLKEKYFGKMLLFVSLSVVQSLIIVFTTKFILHIYTENFFLMIMVGLVSAFTFSTIVYTLVSIFGNLGKAAAVVLVVAQIAGSGATYPIQLAPLVFRIIQPLFPFTYSVSGFREAIGGPLISTVTIDFSILILMSAAAILMGLFLKKPLYEMTNRLHDKFVESGIGG
jgi:putative membrane protein